jgi:hypothetical protein
MPTLEQLFKTKKIDGNLTAEQKYDIRNSKDIRVIDGFAINGLRKSALSNRTRETRLEEELIGVRAIRGLRSPILYGTDILRLKEKTTPILNDMKLEANGAQTQDGGLVGKQLDKLTGGKVKSLQDVKTKVKQLANKISNKLGIDYPQIIIPTRMINDDDFKNSSPHELADTLIKLKQKSEGNLPGQILSSVFRSSTPNQIGNKIVGEALRIGKQQFKKAIFGVNEINLGSIKVQPNIGIGRRKSLLLNTLSVYTNKDSVNVVDQNVKGTLPKYTSYVNPTADILSEKNDLATLYSQRYNEIASLDAGEMNLLNRSVANASIPVGPSSPRFERYSVRRGYPNDSQESGYELEKNIETSRGMTSKSDYLNNLGPYSSPNGESQKDGTNKFYEDYDFVPLRFYSIAKETSVNFRATLFGLTENLSPSWDPNKTLGNPFSYYTYSGIERSITFSFKVFSLNANEHKQAWEKINFLTGLVYPANGIGVSGNVFITPPFLKLTLGDMFKSAEGFIETLSYSVDDNSPWEIGFDIDRNSDVENYKLPRIINVDITYKFLDTMGDSYSIGEDGTFLANRFYSFGGVGKNQSTRKGLENGSNLDGSTNTTLPDAVVSAKRINSGIKKDIDKISDAATANLKLKDIKKVTTNLASSIPNLAGRVGR